jgi:D-alanyl-lipoteichoic acid acyltransferase DltB (MBOAT superfamily)
MLFNSAQFLLAFLPAVLAIYYFLPHRAQNIFLVVASCFFYSCWDWRFLLPLLFTTSLDYVIARRMVAATLAGAPDVVRRRLMVVSVVTNLGLLGVFKYFNFFAQSAVQLSRQFGAEVELQVFEIILPVAISFYTFQALSYTIDVYRGELHPTESFWDFFLAVLYFPHLVAGPIQRAASLLPQITQPRVIRRDQVFEGLHLMLWGYFKKVYIADNLAPFVDAAFSGAQPSTAAVLVGVLAFTFQIYCDFSGYTDIARGIAKLMGFEFGLNFNLPYCAVNPSDFWRRWHISLSSWLGDYLYKPLGGSRTGRWLTYRNLMLTMLLGGLWHGAAWNYVLWGAYHGLIQVLHRVHAPLLARLGQRFAHRPALWLGIRMACMFLMTCYGWLLFRATSLEQVAQMTLALLQPAGAMDWAGLGGVARLVAPLVLVQCIQWHTRDLYFTRHLWSGPPARVITYATMVYTSVFLGGQPQSFVYFQF